MVVYRINETLQTGAVTNRTYRAGETVYLFLKFTIKAQGAVEVERRVKQHVPVVRRNLSVRRRGLRGANYE